MTTASDIERGPDTGALARIAPDDVRSALRGVRDGKVYDLGLELNEMIPQGQQDFVPFRLSWRASPEHTGPFQYSLESISGTLHIGTHIDGLAHVAADGHMYGGCASSEGRDDRGWREHGMETVPPIIGRAVILDVARALGAEQLPDGYEITVDDLRRAGAGTTVELRTGDVVLVRTGKVREFYVDAAKYQASQPGVGPDAAIWLFEAGMAVLGTDTTSTEPIPMADAAHSVHRILIAERGVHLMENLYLDELGRDGVTEGVVVALPLKITGATGSWIRPVVII